MVRKAKQIGIAAAMILATLLVPAQAAYAADGCGEGWFKQSDGYLEKDDPWQGTGSHNAWIYHSGKVRFCTDDDTFNNDENRRALIGYPSDSYPFESWVFKNGTYTKFCVKQTVKAHMTGIESSTSWTLGGSVSKSSAGVSYSYSATYDTLTLTVAKTATCSTSASQIVARTSGITLTADDETGVVDWVQLTTTLTTEYWVNGTKYVQNHSLVENDYS
ncbi:hypothetical protein [Nocardioides sp. WS12]|uniref:hypothetical protein n=1 Tax=Nocardioides sp. WS12 TaxID=2486272 RepID=UPI0015FE0444|nr:hypothetical protein [Nocardioides sp. WS12]